MSSKTEGTSAATAESKGEGSSNTKAEKSLIEALEEDDEFEEFQPEHWSKSETSAAAAGSTQQWMDNWDDDIEDDFVKALREELVKSGTVPTK
jgi:DSS1/SEM1 family